MTTINLGTASPTGDVKHIDLKHPAIQIHPVQLDTPSLTPATTPEETSPAEETTMAGKKVFSLERPDDKARELAVKLTLEEQVRSHFFRSRKSLEPQWKEQSDTLFGIDFIQPIGLVSSEKRLVEPTHRKHDISKTHDSWQVQRIIRCLA